MALMPKEKMTVPIDYHAPKAKANFKTPPRNGEICSSMIKLDT